MAKICYKCTAGPIWRQGSHKKNTAASSCATRDDTWFIFMAPPGLGNKDVILLNLSWMGHILPITNHTCRTLWCLYKWYLILKIFYPQNNNNNDNNDIIIIYIFRSTFTLCNAGHMHIQTLTWIVPLNSSEITSIYSVNRLYKEHIIPPITASPCINYNSNQ